MALTSRGVKNSSAALKASTPGSEGPKKKIALPLHRRLRNLFKKHQYSSALTVVAVSVAAAIYIAWSNPAAQVLVNDPTLIELVNQRGSGSVAKASETFEEWTLENVKSQLGNIFWSRAMDQTPECIPTSDSFPDHFDSRSTWPKCFEHPPFELSKNCSASWATATADMITSRLCILDSEYSEVRLSAQDMLSCDALNKGCKYGALDAALYGAMLAGVVSTKCFPYSGSTRGVQCADKCKDEMPVKLASYCKLNSDEAMKKEIVANGPLTTLLVLHDDFLVYGGGVYAPHPTAKRLVDVDRNPLTHGVSVIGWGRELDTGAEYWIVQTNFGASWGENGVARIARSARVLIESGSLAGVVINPSGSTPQDSAQDDDLILEE